MATPEGIPAVKISETSQPRLARGCRLGDDGMLLVPEGVLKLKGTGAEIVRRCDGRRTIADIVSEMRTQFIGMPEGDVENFLGRLHDRGVVEW